MQTKAWQVCINLICGLHYGPMGGRGGTMGHFALPKKICGDTCMTTDTCRTMSDPFPL
jgi:hypothetical protein